MIAVLVIVAVVVVLGLGFYFTRGARGPAPFDAEGRMVDTRAHAGPLGEAMPFPEGEPEHEPSVGDLDVAGLGLDALQPGVDRRVGLELEPALRRHVRVGVERDVGDRVALADERFARTYEREAAGLAGYFHDAIVANAAGAGATLST